MGLEQNIILLAQHDPQVPQLARVRRAVAVAGDLDQVDGGAYISQLASNTPSAANVRAYAEIVREKSILRQLIKVGNQISDAGFRPNWG